ncbi:MAG: hypothetical protein ACI97A_002460 [Planctomycetota bacterium]|jgi:hypothetical protein
MGKGWITILVFVVLCTGIGVAEADFVLDAQRVVAGNRLIDEGSFGEIMNSRWWYDETDVNATLYRPLPTLWFAMLGKLGSGREDPRPFHLGSLVLHIFCALARYALILILLASWSQKQMLAFLGAAIPALHAVSFESVVCIVGSAEILASLFMTLSWVAFIAGLRKRGPSDGALFLFSSALLWFFAVLSKETSVLFPAILLLQWWFERAKDKELAPKGGLILSLLLFVAAGGGWWFLRSNALGGATIDFAGGPYGEFTAPQRILSALAVIGSQYLPSLVFPFGLMPNLTHQDVPPPTSFLSINVIFGVLAVVGVFAAFVYSWLKKQTAASMLLAFAMISFAPVSNLIVGIGTVGGFRLLYSPLFGLLAALVVVLGATKTKQQVRKIGFAALGAVALIATVATFPLISAWKDSRSLAIYSTDQNPMSVWAMQNDISSHFTSGFGPVDLKEFTEAFDSLDRVEPNLATLPGSDRLDRDSRVICHRLFMQRAGAEGTYATTLRDASVALEHIQRGIRAAVNAEEYGWGDNDRVFEARLATFRLRLVALSHAMRTQDQEEAKTTKSEASGDSVILERLMDGELTNRNRLAFLFEAARFAQMDKKTDLVDSYVERGLAIDATDPQLTVMQATRMYEKKDIQGAYRVMMPVIESGRGGIEEYYLTSELCRQLGKSSERMTILRQAMRLEARNENEVQLRGRIVQMLNGS